MSDPALVSSDLLDAVTQLRADATARGAVAASVTFRTADGEVTLDWRAGDWLRVTFSGDAPERTYVLPPDWNAA